MTSPQMTITSDDILGKEAVDNEGEILGIVMKLHIDKEAKSLLGVTVDQGFMKPDIFIGLNYIERFGIDALFLNSVPPEKFRGLKVLTPGGRIFGTVKDVIFNEDKIEGFVVLKKGSFIKKKKMIIPSSAIKDKGASLVLKKADPESFDIIKKN